MTPAGAFPSRLSLTSATRGGGTVWRLEIHATTCPGTSRRPARRWYGTWRNCWPGCGATTHQGQAVSPRPKGRPQQREGVPETGRRIRQAREARGLSIVACAQMAGLGAATLGSWERGDREIGLSQLLRVARVLGVDPGSLLPFPPPFTRLQRGRAEALRLCSVPADSLTDAGVAVTRELAAGHLRRALAGTGGTR